MTAKDDLFAQNRAIYLPALSKPFALFAHSGSFKRPLPFTATDLNFLDPHNRLFHYPYALYSAGQAAKAKALSWPPDIVSARSRDRTIVLGDSGGFQVQSGTIEFEGRETTRRMMRWMEAQTDYSMVLDFPTGGIASGMMHQHTERLQLSRYPLAARMAANGLSADYNACLLQTEINNKQFVRERHPGATQFLNVLQGRNERESKVWYDAVKRYPFEGWAFAGGHQANFSMTLRRLIEMREEGLLQRFDWLHILGISRLDVGCLFTVLQRAVREHVNPRFQISFDSASPFKTAGNYQVYTGHTVDATGWSTHTANLAKHGRSDDGRHLNDLCLDLLPTTSGVRFNSHRWAANTHVGTLRVSDLCVGDQANNLDNDGSLLLMHHNIEVLTRAHQRAVAVYDGEDPTLIPYGVRAVATMIEEVFKSASPLAAIEEWSEHLDMMAR